MKKKAVMIKDFFSADGAVHVNEVVKVVGESNDYYRIESQMGKLYTIPKHIIKFIPWLILFFFVY